MSVMTVQVVTEQWKLVRVRSRVLNCLATDLIFFLTLTTPAGILEYIQYSVETPCITVTQLHPFTAGIDSSVINNEQKIDSSPVESNSMGVVKAWFTTTSDTFFKNETFQTFRPEIEEVKNKTEVLVFTSQYLNLNDVSRLRLVELFGRDWSR